QLAVVPLVQLDLADPVPVVGAPDRAPVAPVRQRRGQLARVGAVENGREPLERSHAVPPGQRLSPVRCTREIVTWKGSPAGFGSSSATARLVTLIRPASPASSETLDATLTGSPAMFFQPSGPTNRSTGPRSMPIRTGMAFSALRARSARE